MHKWKGIDSTAVQVPLKIEYSWKKKYSAIKKKAKYLLNLSTNSPLDFLKKNIKRKMKKKVIPLAINHSEDKNEIVCLDKNIICKFKKKPWIFQGFLI